jgi:hypothetical protein
MFLVLCINFDLRGFVIYYVLHFHHINGNIKPIDLFWLTGVQDGAWDPAK